MYSELVDQILDQLFLGNRAKMVKLARTHSESTLNSMFISDVVGFTVATAGTLPESIWKRVCSGSLAVSWLVNLQTETLCH